MKVIILQGMPCLGKSHLLKHLGENCKNCRIFSIDTYSEALWDKYGFSSKRERDRLYENGVIDMFNDLETLSNDIDYVILDGVFSKKREKHLEKYLESFDGDIKTIYMYPADYKEHKVVWTNRSRNFRKRHPGHGATKYSNGRGSMYTNKYEDHIHKNMKTYGEILEVIVSFNEYTLSHSYEEILQFITK